MSWRHILFDTLYRVGRPIWDIPVPDELRDAVEGDNALPPGLALDVGCGTGTNVRYLAGHGWRATGVDFSTAAIRQAQDEARGDITIERTVPKDFIVNRMKLHHTITANWYWLRRR